MVQQTVQVASTTVVMPDQEGALETTLEPILAEQLAGLVVGARVWAGAW